MDPKDKSVAQYIKFINQLHSNWEPHAGQVEIGRELFYKGTKEIFAQCGRNWGKTDFVIYTLWRYALMNPGSENYYFSPYQKQSKEIIWESKRLHNFADKSWFKGKPNNTELRIRLFNDSFIKLDGSDNIDAYRGVKPRGITILDEFKDFRPGFYDAYNPNLAAHDSPLVVIGTPPDREGEYTALSNVFQKSKSKYFYKGTSYENPHIPKIWLDNKKEELEIKGEMDVWDREYLAEFTQAGASKIFPMFDKDKFVVPHARLLKEIERDAKRLQYFVVADPAGSSVFGVLFGALNPYTKKWYMLDEIYEKAQEQMSSRQIGPRIHEKMKELAPRAEWRLIYDEAASWWHNEMMSTYGDFWEPSQKAQNKKEDGISLMKDIYIDNKEMISDRCVNYVKEVNGYYKDENGMIPKRDDHLIDDRRYMNGSAYYELNPELPELGTRRLDDLRPHDEFEEYRG